MGMNDDFPVTRGCLQRLITSLVFYFLGVLSAVLLIYILDAYGGNSAVMYLVVFTLFGLVISLFRQPSRNRDMEKD